MAFGFCPDNLRFQDTTQQVITLAYTGSWSGVAPQCAWAMARGSAASSLAGGLRALAGLERASG